MMINIINDGDSFEMPSGVEFRPRAKNILKAEIKRRGIGYKQLANKLAEIGVHETERNIANKISRGGFSAAFFLQCLSVIGCKTVSIED